MRKACQKASKVYFHDFSTVSEFFIKQSFNPRICRERKYKIPCWISDLLKRNYGFDFVIEGTLRRETS